MSSALDYHDKSTKLSPLVIKFQVSLDLDVPSTIPTSIPEPVQAFFVSVSSPAEILSSKLVSRVKGTDVIKGGYNFVHILNLDIGESHPFPFVLRFPIDPDSISRSQTCTAVGCMLYCQRHPDLNIPTPAIYAYSCTHGSEFIAMEYIDGDALSDVWLDIPEGEKEDIINQIAEVMRSMRTKTSFHTMGGISPDGSACPLVDGMDDRAGEVLVESFGLYNTGPYKSVREYLQAVLDRRYHYLDQMLHKGTLPAKCKEEMSKLFSHSTLEEVLERVKRLREKFKANPYDRKYPFVLRHGDLHGRNVLVSRSSPRRILGIIDWDFGGSHALPFADSGFELAYPDSDRDTNERIKQAEELQDSELLLDRVVGQPCSSDAKLKYWMTSTRSYVLDFEAAPVVLSTTDTQHGRYADARTRAISSPI
ncbi:kinase-like domain-containing protein [Boletus edulis BED1]|uniref:Kinase-like domain-containing protein n=1 Tax=Boletus edulis BED1 TaxID=1328754 RepID=A0AAD4GAV0_BOLED|nr:kinase-like domain-containing protein [Boletus edulis BED1]